MGNQVQWEDVPQAQTSQPQWEDVPASTSSFKSGSAFEDTKSLIPDLPAMWEEFKKEWANRKNTPMTNEDMVKMMKDEHAAGSAVLDTIGALPAMAVGGVAGLGSAVTNMDASKGLETGSKVMNALLPSTLLGNEDDHNREGYKAAMAPLTAVMDTLNAVPQGYGEMLNATGHVNAAGQLTDAGKLAIMATMGIKGAKEAYHALTKAPIESHAEKLDIEKLNKVEPKWEDVQPTKQSGATDRGIPPSENEPQGQLFSEPDAPTQPIPDENQLEMFGQPPAPEGTINYEKTFPFDLEPMVEPNKGEMGINMPEPDVNGDLVPKNSISTQDLAATPGRNFFLDPANRDKIDLNEVPQNPFLQRATDDHLEKLYMEASAKWHKGDESARDTMDEIASIQAKRRTAALYAANADKAQEIFPGFTKIPEGTTIEFEHRGEVVRGKVVATRSIQTTQGFVHLPRVELADGRRVSVQPEAIKQVFGKPKLVDFHGDHDFAREGLGDKSLMGHEATGAMVDALHNGDIHGALGAIVKGHDNVLYRKLADFLKDKLGDLKVVMHDEGILGMGDRHATGYYDPSTHTVGLSKVGAVSPHTVLHELVHAVTSKFMNDRPTDMRVTGLTGLFKGLSADISKEFPNIVNAKEFVAEAFSNPEFQDFLKEHRVANRSMWRRFVDNVKSILGMSSSTRNPLTNALEHTIDLAKQVVEAGKDNTTPLKDAGVPSKLADLMVTRQPERPNQGVRNENMQALKGIAKVKAQFDFTPLKPEEVIPMARTAPDIPKGTLETIKANLDAGGRFASLRHSNNPVVKYTFAHVDAAIKSYEKLIRDNITDKEVGIKTLLQKLNTDDFTIVHSLMMLDEGVRERTPQQLRELRWSEDMIAAHQRILAVDKDVLKRVNEVRAQMNPPLPPISERIGHLAGRFLGDFSHMVYEKNPDGTRGDPVMRITGTTRWGAKKLADFYKSEHPEWEVGEQEYNNIKMSNNSDRFQGFKELMNYIGRNDKNVARALDTLDKYNRRAATNYLNTLRHAKDKKLQPGGIIGSEGHKAWVDAQTNAEQGFKGHLAYLDTTFKWMEMQKAMENISKVTTDKEVTIQQPNAIKWSTAYTDHALHRNQGFLTEMANSLLSEIGRVFGLGHTNITKGINWMSSAEMRNWMGIGNIPFALKHMLLPFQKMPAMMTYLKANDLDASLTVAGAKSLSSYYHYLKDSTNGTTPFEKEAFKYARDNNVFNVTLDNLSGAIQASKTRRFLGKVADADFSGPEHAIRGTAFFFYAHFLERAGMDTQGALSAAEHMTKALYTDYAPHEAPRAAAKAGWIGQLAFQITRYKANEISQLGFFNRERIPFSDADHTAMQKIVSNTPLMVHLGSLLAFTGVTGMLAYNEMDKMYSLFRKYVMQSPDNLTALLQRSKAPELVKYGLFSLIGIDSKIKESDLLPAPFPTTTEEISQMGKAFNAVRFHDKYHAQQLALSLTPSTFRGYMENHMFTSPEETSGPHKGESLYYNPNTGEGRVWRDAKAKAIRNIGFHTSAETDEVDNNYAITRIEGDNRDIAEHILDKARGLMASNALTPQAAQELGRQYARHQQTGQPDFASALTSYAMGRKTSQQEQMLLKAGRDRMGNTATIVTRNK